MRACHLKPLRATIKVTVKTCGFANFAWGARLVLGGAGVVGIRGGNQQRAPELAAGMAAFYPTQGDAGMSPTPSTVSKMAMATSPASLSASSTVSASA